MSGAALGAASRAPFGEAASDILTWPLRVARDRIVVHCLLAGDPVSKQRPRFAMNANGTVYTPKHTKVAEREIAQQIRLATRNLIPDDSHSFGVRVIFYTKTYQRRDIDNMCKLVFDACNGVVWKDDAQVDELIARCVRSDPDPRTELAIYHHGIIHRMTRKCEVCGGPCPVYPSQARRFCSKRCSALSQQSGLNEACAHCHKPVYRVPSMVRGGRQFFCSRACMVAHRAVELTCAVCRKPYVVSKGTVVHRQTGKPRSYCSLECQAEAIRVRPMLTSVGRGVCQTCGGPTSKAKYTGCDFCRIKTKIAARGPALRAT